MVESESNSVPEEVHGGKHKELCEKGDIGDSLFFS